jgi:hypothetical protein
MSNNTQNFNKHRNSNKQSSNEPLAPKPGRTLLVKPTTTIDLSLLDTLDGFQSKHYADKSNSYFVTFATADNSNNALTLLKTKFGNTVNVKFAHYRVYFTLQGLVDTTDYSLVKSAHSALVSEKANCNVLYYRLYRKSDSYLGCGDMTIDTKEGMDVLMNRDNLKSFTLNPELSGVHYRYNKTRLDNGDRQPRQNGLFNNA